MKTMKTTKHRIECRWTSPSGIPRAKVLRVVETRQEAETELGAYVEGLAAGWRPVRYKDGEASGITFRAVPSSSDFFRIRGGDIFDSPITRNQVVALVERDDNLGLCVNCGDETSGIEPDARRYKCDACGEFTLYGAEEVLLMIGCF